MSLILGLAALALLTSACTLPSVISGPALLGGAPTLQPTRTATGFPFGRFGAISAPDMVTLAIEQDGRFRIYLHDGMLDWGKFDVNGTHVMVESMTCAERAPSALLTAGPTVRRVVSLSCQSSSIRARTAASIFPSSITKYEFIFNPRPLRFEAVVIVTVLEHELISTDLNGVELTPPMGALLTWPEPTGRGASADC